MGVNNILAAVKEAVLRMLVLMLALILVMLVASRNVEYELEQEALNSATEQTQTTAKP